MRTHVDLFTGIGGFSLACEWAGVETIAFSEVDSYASRVLQRHWPGIRNYGDVRSFPSLSAWLLTAGVPCQPASVAGKRKGAEDDRWLWPETLAVVENGSYEWLLFENPTGILSLNDGLEFERICVALEGQGYEVQPLVIPDCAVGLPTMERHLWLAASRNGIRLEGYADNGMQRKSLPERGRWSYDARIAECAVRWNSDKPRLLRGRKGIPGYVDRIRCLGNAVSPPVVYQLIKRMIEAEAS